MAEQPLSYVVLEFYAWDSKWEHWQWNPQLVDRPQIKKDKEKNKKDG